MKQSNSMRQLTDSGEMASSNDGDMGKQKSKFAQNDAAGSEDVKDDFF